VLQDAAAVAERYARFAETEVGDRSPLYAAWARGVAADPELQAILARIPATSRQPPLVFAVTRLLGAPEDGFAPWAEWVRAHADDVVAEASVRRLQTNEPLRCAALVPALSLVEGPIALVEVGASAGLCLYPDRYAYRYTSAGGADVVLEPAGGSRVHLESALTGTPALRLPDVVWRAGVDLHPLDAADATDRRFLTTLVWPGETGRAERIGAALDIAAADPPVLVAGDATDLEVLDALIAQAPAGATVVVTTPGVMPHIPWAGRQRLAAHLLALPVEWISIEAPTDASSPAFTLTRGGVVLADVDPLGASVVWRPGAEATGV
jgi:hypothetical protein